jgi:hypothetical protein
VVICYFSAGSYEPDRPDSTSLAATALGSVLDGWPDERWVDTRSMAVREIMRRRLDFAVSQGCNGVEPDNVDAYDNDNGLGLTTQDQLDYDNFLAHEAHARGLSIGLKNSLALIPNLVATFDWALDEQCLEFGECASLQPFIAAGKAVFHCEYTDSTVATAGTGPGTNPGTGTPPGSGSTPNTGDDMDKDMDSDPDPDMDAEPDMSMDTDTGTDPKENTAGEEGDQSEPEPYVYISADPSAICASRPAGFSTIIKNLDLDAYRLACN